MISIETKDMVRAADAVGLTIQKRQVIPILTGMRIRRDGDGVQFTGTDLDTTVIARSPADMNGADFDMVLMEPKSVVRAMKHGGADSITISPENNDYNACLKSGDLEIYSNTYPGSDFPRDPLSETPYWSGTLGKEALETLKRILPAVSSEETRYYLNGIFLCTGGPWSVTAVATDGHRMALADFPVPDAEGALGWPGETKSRGLIVPRRAVDLLLRLAARQPDKPIHTKVVAHQASNAAQASDLAQSPSSIRMVFDIGDVRMITKLIDGTYPDYQRVIPDNPTRLATFDLKAFRRAIESISMGSEKPTIKMLLTPGTAQLSCRWVSNNSKASTKLSWEGNALDGAEEFTAGANGRYLRWICQTFGACERITLAFDDDIPNKGMCSDPITIASPDDDGVKLILMPMRI